MQPPLTDDKHLHVNHRTRPRANSRDDSNPAYEYDDALKVIIEHEKKELDMKKFVGLDITQRPFTLKSGQVIKLKILKSRVKSFPIMFGNQEDFVFPLPTNTIAKRISAYYHTKFHWDIDTVVTKIWKEFWIVSLQRIMSKIDKNCRQCLIVRQKVASQVMGSMPASGRR